MNLIALSQRIRDLRRDRKLTLEKLAQRSGTTRSCLSKIENGRITPSLPLLSEVAVALGVTLADLVRGLDDKPKIAIVREGERIPAVRSDRANWKAKIQSLIPTRLTKTMDPFVIKVPANTKPAKALSHQGEEFFYVLKGDVRLEYDGQTHQLRTGDAAYLNAELPHRLINPGKAAAEILVVYTGHFGRNLT
jgi:transcriptional regulator with XRE-family HTH domain